MYYLIYISTAIKLMSEKELSDILIKSQINNLKNNITGMLLYAQGTFIQVLEGEEEQVNNTYKVITGDKRHKNLIELISGPLDDRVFPEWTMGFVTLHPEKLKELVGYINPENKILKDTAPHQAITILKTFAETNKLTGI